MVLDELVAYLAAHGIGTAAVDIFYGSMKDTFPDEVVLLQEYGGIQDEPNMSDPGGAPGYGVRLEYPRIQVLHRGKRDDYVTPRTKAEATRKVLMAVNDTSLSGVHYSYIEILQPPYRLRTDANFRIEIAYNIQVCKRLS